MQEMLSTIEGHVWGPVMLFLLGGVGIYLTLRLKLIQFMKLGYAFKALMGGRTKDDGEGDITPFNSLMTALSATVGTGNIAGVATAIFLGGPGALFYMWVIALIGMATKYSECLLGAEYRERASDGSYTGGPMYYMKNGIGGGFGKTLAGIYAVFLMLAAIGAGNSVQANSIAATMNTALDVPHWVTGLVLAVIVALVIVGGIKRIGDFAGKVVPLMFVLYVVTGLVILIANAGEIPAAFATIVGSAFNGKAAAGGFAGATVMMAIQFGVARGVFSNESGIGTASIAHAAAQTKSPVKQAHIAMLGTFFDSLIICSITGLAIVITGAYESGENGALLTVAAFSDFYGGAGPHIVNIALALFVLTTVITWYYYGERGLHYFGAGKTVIAGYKAFWIGFLIVSANAELALVWTGTSIMFGLLVFPNAIALLMLSPKIIEKTQEFWKANQSDQSSDSGQSEQPSQS